MSKVVVVTGASRGIGRNIAYNLAVNGYTVIANYNASEDKAISLKEELNNQNIEIDIFKANVSKVNEIKKLIDFAVEKYGKIDALINNAGMFDKLTLFTTFICSSFKLTKCSFK